MKKYALLSLLHGANRVLADCYAKDFAGALAKFRMLHPVLCLNAEGYAKNMDITYCIAEYYDATH